MALAWSGKLALVWLKLVDESRANISHWVDGLSVSLHDVVFRSVFLIDDNFPGWQ